MLQNQQIKWNLTDKNSQKQIQYLEEYITNQLKQEDVKNDNDEIKMEVNTTTKTLRYFVNGEDQGIAFENIDFETRQYNMFVFAGDKNVKIKLTEFVKCIA